MISIVIPAYNEASVIERTLLSVIHAADVAFNELSSGEGSVSDNSYESALRPEFPPRPEIIVACNGCHDETPRIASKFGDSVRVLDLAEGSKIGALNAGDAAATLFPRFYLDADIELSGNALAAVSRVLLHGKIHAAAPRMVCDTAGTSWPVRAFYKTWLSRPYHRHGHIGSGFVGINQAGRERFGVFPNLIADDEFIRRHFTAAERQVVPDATFTIRVPKTTSSLIKVKTRSRLGTLQLIHQMPDLVGNARPLLDTSEIRPETNTASISEPSLIAKVAYGAITMAARARARWQYGNGQFGVWERDETSR